MGNQELEEQISSPSSRPVLLALRGLIDDRLAELEEEESWPEKQMSSQDQKDKSQGAGWVELKTIHGYGPYAYLRWRVGKRIRSKYLGKAKAAGS